MMTSITTLNSSGVSSRQAISDSQKANLDYDAFLRLFVASMKNQDPTKPNDPSQTLSQLATFSNVEQSIKLNDKLDLLIESSEKSVTASLLGKTLASLDGSVSGVVAGIENAGTGFTAILSDGRKLDLSLGYKITPS